jgi:hypothetical protein
METLRSARIKIQRAKDHIAYLRREMDAWLGRKPYYLVSETDAKAGKIVVKIRVREQIPDQFSAVIGDIIHNFRSALDHLAWALVLVNKGMPSERTQFPINKDRKSLEAALPRCLAGASSKAIEAVKKLQPHKGGYGAPGNEILWAIHDLDRIDKHRLIVPIGAAHTRSQMRFSVGIPLHKNFQWIGPPIVGANKPLAIPVEDGKTVAELIQVGAPLPPEIQLNCKVTFSILFSDGNALSRQPLAETLPIMGKHVEDIINTFDAKFFR